MTEVPAFNWFDVVLVVAVLFSTVSGLRAGLARVVVGIAAAIAGFMAGFWCYRIVGAKLQFFISSEHLANLAGFLLILFGVLAAGALLSAILSKLFQWVGLSWFNHFLGGVAGALRGAIVIAALLSFAVAFAPSPMPDALARSTLLPYASEISSALVSLAPHDLKDAFSQQLANLQALWHSRMERRQENKPAI